MISHFLFYVKQNLLASTLQCLCGLSLPTQPAVVCTVPSSWCLPLLALTVGSLHPLVTSPFGFPSMPLHSHMGRISCKHLQKHFIVLCLIPLSNSTYEQLEISQTAGVLMQPPVLPINFGLLFLYTPLHPFIPHLSLALIIRSLEPTSNVTGSWSMASTNSGATENIKMNEAVVQEMCIVMKWYQLW